MEQLQGIEALKKGVKFAIGLANQVTEVMKDGKFSWTEGFSFVDELQEGAVVIKTGKQIVEELKELSVEERTELNAYVQSEFDIADDRVEKIVEDSLGIAFSIVSLIASLKKAE